MLINIFEIYSLLDNNLYSLFTVQQTDSILGHFQFLGYNLLEALNGNVRFNTDAKVATGCCTNIEVNHRVVVVMVVVVVMDVVACSI